MEDTSYVGTFDEDKVDTVLSSQEEKVEGFQLPRTMLVAVIDWDTTNQLRQLELDGYYDESFN